jgi:endonuclease YncB( thermonuclease family)
MAIPSKKTTQRRNTGKATFKNGQLITRKCRVAGIIDGDTIDVMFAVPIYWGFGKRLIRERIRVWPIQAPEKGETGFKEATDLLGYLLSLGDELRITYYSEGNKQWRGAFGRLLGIITVETGWFRQIDVSEAMLKAGYAKLYHAPDLIAPEALQRYRQVEQDAARQKVGLWGFSDVKTAFPHTSNLGKVVKTVFKGFLIGLAIVIIVWLFT